MEKYVISDEAYDAREGTYRKYRQARGRRDGGSSRCRQPLGSSGDYPGPSGANTERIPCDGADARRACARCLLSVQAKLAEDPTWTLEKELAQRRGVSMAGRGAGPVMAGSGAASAPAGACRRAALCP